MIRKPSSWLPLTLGAILVLGVIAPASAVSLARYADEFLKALQKAPKHADELPSLKSSPKSMDEGLGLNGPLISKALARATHSRTCPSMRLRVSLPQLNVRVTVPENLNIRSGPGTNYQRQTRFSEAGTYVVDLLETHICWVQVRYKVDRGLKETGWVYSKYLKFTFDNHLTKPQKLLFRNLGAEGVYELAARSTYKIETPTSQGTAVAISPTVLLTNCHVLGKHKTVHIIEGEDSYFSYLIHDDYSKDKCFIRSLTLEVRPVPNVQNFDKINQGVRAYSIGAPLGFNRSIGEGAVLEGRQLDGVRWVYATAPVEPGSSGGGLFDSKGNLLGITTIKGQNYSISIAAEDFWK